jgi:hypothetical protein
VIAVDKELLSTIANVCAILTFLAAVAAWLNFKWERWAKASKLENYLKQELLKDEIAGKSGRRTALHLTRHVGLTEDEILRASFFSKHIDRMVSIDPETGRASQLLFFYKT